MRRERSCRLPEGPAGGSLGAMDLTNADRRRIAYLYSRYPVVSQTFCDSEMLELESRGLDLTIASINPPSDIFRHERHRAFRAEVLYPPPLTILKAWESSARASGRWQEVLGEMIERHDCEYGRAFKAAIRARNALYFAERFQRAGIGQIHVHFANRATHTALFIKQLTGIPFSFTAHAQDFMVDLGSDALLREMCREAAFVVAVSDFSRELLVRTCPESADKIVRIYNGIRLDDFPAARHEPGRKGPLRLISVGRLIEFKGFHHLLAACGQLKQRGIDCRTTLVGEGPWRQRLEEQRVAVGLTPEEFVFAGTRTQEEVKGLLAASDAFVLPCIVDSQGASDILPTVIMEAMAARLPIVSTQLAGVPEMVEHERNGLLVAPGDEAALADALAAIAHDSTLRHAMGEEGHFLCAEKFAREKTATALLDRLHSVPAFTGKEPEKPSALYVLDTWPFPEQNRWLQMELDHLRQKHPSVTVLVCAPSAGRLEAFPPVEGIEFLPDAMVLEAEWQSDRSAAKLLTESRALLPDTLSTERFFLEARRAVQIAVMLRKRGIRHVHAARSDAALACWMAFRLGAAERFSFAAEADAFLDGKTLDVLEKDAKVCSRADGGDPLRLAPPARRHLVIGPAKIRTGYEATPDREEIVQRWTAHLFASQS